MPGSSDPISSSSDSARAALIVTAASASSGDRPRFTTANDMASARFGAGEVPGLKSVPIATGTPASTKARAGAWWSFIRNQVVIGSRVATTGVARLGRGGHRARCPAFGRRGKVVGRCGLQLRGELRAAGRRQLVGVQARLHAERARGLEDPPRLVRA